MYRKFGKRLFDIVASLLGLVILSPLLLIISVLVRIKLGSPVIFSQNRPGLNEKIFKLYKFRTMTDAYDEQGILLPDTERYTKFGKLLRSTSLDELPELWNILKGDMSAVGPRPLMPEYLPYYTPEESRRHHVRPGLTGLSQVNGRSLLTWEQKFEYDIYYVDHISFWNDLKIIFKTIKKVFCFNEVLELGEGANINFITWRELLIDKDEDI